MSACEVEVLGSDAWARVRALRLAALTSDPYAYGATAEREAAYDESHWRETAAQDLWLAAVIEGHDVGVMAVEAVLPPMVVDACPTFVEGCAWLYGCWVAKDARGSGVPAAFVQFLDGIAGDRGWRRQGLGVFTDNVRARRAYERLGFVTAGEPLESRRKPGTYFQPMFRTVTCDYFTDGTAETGDIQITPTSVGAGVRSTDRARRC